MIEPWREPVRGGHPDPHVLALPGIEQLRRMLTGATPAPPLSRLTGMHVEAVADGSATFTMPLSRWLQNADGSIPPGALAIVADAAMACAILTLLPARTPLTTSELALRVVRPVQAGGSIRATASVISLGSPVALAEASLHDDQGVLIGHGSSLCITLPGASIADLVGHPPATADGPDPWQREPPAAEQPPLYRLTGLAAAGTDGSAVQFTLPASPWFQAPPPGRVQGGIVALLADAALAGAVRNGSPAAIVYTPMEFKLNYLRPLASDGRTVRASGRLVHSGRRIAVASAEVVDADGRPIAVASGSGLLAVSE